MTQDIPIQRALISVSDKTDIVGLAEFLHGAGVDIISTGNTAKLLAQHHIPTTEIADYTGYPEMLDGRVKTLHPKIYGGILGRRDIDAQFMREHNIPDIDLVIVNLYPFVQTVENQAVTQEIIENIDIGGPSMIRAAAKNFTWCTVIVSPNQYPSLIDEMQSHQGQVSLTFRKTCMRKAFSHTSQYEQAIEQYFHHYETDQKDDLFPESLSLNLIRKERLRYGENPHQQAAIYINQPNAKRGVAHCHQHQGKALSYNNYNDAETALECVSNMKDAACVIVKHANPCGVAIDDDLFNAYQKAFAADPESAFGGIIAFNRPVGQKLIETILEQQFVEVIIAPQFSEHALNIAQHKPNVRCLSYPQESLIQPSYDIKSIHGGLLVQEWDEPCIPELNIVTEKKPTQTELIDAKFAWHVCHYVKSNAIVFAKDGKTLGIGAGQSSRIFSTKIASQRAQKVDASLSGSVMASDAFFPFADNIELAKELGITTLIQPGGSIKDHEVIARCDALGLAMILTNIRHFRH